MNAFCLPINKEIDLNHDGGGEYSISVWRGKWRCEYPVTKAELLNLARLIISAMLAEEGGK